MTCKICGASTPEPNTECCGDHCRRKLQCLRIAWDREARKVGINGYYDRRYQEHLRTHNARGAKTMWKEWQDAKARLGERP